MPPSFPLESGREPPKIGGKVGWGEEIGLEKTKPVGPAGLEASAVKDGEISPAHLWGQSGKDIYPLEIYEEEGHRVAAGSDQNIADMEIPMGESEVVGFPDEGGDCSNGLPPA
jgi:hypothetical protein